MSKTGAKRNGAAVRLRGPGLALAGLVAAGLGAEPAVAAGSVQDLNQLSLEELANVEVTSVSRTPERLSEAPAAIFVIGREDIRRSGATSLPEVLRLAPNLEVARLNATAYAITARGSNSPQSANKLQVLIDGRSVYTPVASTVFWETLGVDLSAIERIEVISGPAGALWGSNAVNGVINVITRTAADTPGVFAEIGGGTNDRTATVRYGGKLGSTANFRVYAVAFGRESQPNRKPDDITSDTAEGVRGGFRVDGTAGRGDFTVQGDLYHNTIDLLDYRLTGGDILGRWSHPLGDSSSLTVQGYYDRADRRYLVANDLLQSFDLQAQVNTQFRDNHRVVAGAELRVWRSEFDSLVVFGFTDPKRTLTLGSVFAQDEITLSPKVALTLGLKLEDNSYSGVDYLPNVRLAWRPNDRTLLWSAISRAVRTPSRIDRELQGAGILAASPDFDSEVMTAYEVGSRVQPTPATTFSVSGFYNVYDNLRTTETRNGRLPVMLRNGLRARTYGVEAWGAYQVSGRWRMSAGLSTLDKELRLKPGRVDLARMQAAGEDPSYQAFLRSQMNLGSGIELDLGYRRVGRVHPSNVPAYSEADARIGWRIRDGLELSLSGQNLLHASHLEVINPDTAPVTRIPRSVYLGLRWGL